tara:strand:+ start:21225 stop:22217 length:993 start_codon:yes stop_codon:yes gene_type:complete
MKKLIVFTLLIFTFITKVFEINKVEIENNKLNVNGIEYFIKGICYHPVPIGKTKRNFDEIDNDLLLMQEAGINTIRVYSPIDDFNILNKIDKAGIKVITSFGYNQNGYYDILNGTYIDYINKFKEHNAMLLWELGNEYNYHPEWFNMNIENWYLEMNNAAKKIKRIDKNHPVSTAHGEIPNKKAREMGSNIDIWGINVYRWDNPTSLIEEWEKVSDLPLYFSETGSDSYMTEDNNGFKKGINEDAQAMANHNIISNTFKMKDKLTGIVIFQFVDGLWKAGNPEKQDIGGWAPNSTGVPYDGSPNEEFWGIVDINRNKKKTFGVIKEFFNN